MKNVWLYLGNWIKVVVAVIATLVTKAVGGWDNTLLLLIAFMGVDMVTGLFVAFFNKSKKTENGGINSNVGWHGLAKKIMILFFVFIGESLDMLIGTDYVRNAVIYGFCVNELISIIENAGLMGIWIPDFIKESIELLNKKSEKRE